MSRKYVIRYGVINPCLLSDYVIVKNPEYGTRIGKWGSRPVVPSASARRMKSQFYRRLEESIKSDGINNPIFCNSYEEGTFCRYGTSRLWLAKKLKIEVPVIIADYVDRWVDLKELKTKNSILSKFVDKPEVLEIGIEEMRFDGCPNRS